jgi:hypothetical protein
VGLIRRIGRDATAGTNGASRDSTTHIELAFVCNRNKQGKGERDGVV